MTRFAIDAGVALRLVEAGAVLPPEHSLVGPNLLRSDAISMLYRSVRAGERTQREGRRLWQGVVTMRIRLLGDRVSQWTAWGIAADLDWPDTAKAEYLAVAQLQADALVTLDPEIARGAAGIVDLAPIEVLLP